MKPDIWRLVYNNNSNNIIYGVDLWPTMARLAAVAPPPTSSQPNPFRSRSTVTEGSLKSRFFCPPYHFFF
jgi:hypothetical protein